MRISDWSSDVCSSDLHGTGHGVGSFLSVHEGPQRIATFGGGDEPLQPGMILSNEPGYYKTGEYGIRSEEHTSELQSLMRISYAVFCLKKKKNMTEHIPKHTIRMTAHRRSNRRQR